MFSPSQVPLKLLLVLQCWLVLLTATISARRESLAMCMKLAAADQKGPQDHAEQ